MFSVELAAALCLVAVLEGILLFAAPGVWKRTAARMLEQPDAQLRIVGGVMIVAGLALLQFVR
ncbi:MAG: DUF2065 family protein [Lysobacteraceae bacterium]